MKEQLIKLAKDKGFDSVIIGKSVNANYSSKPFYFLWMSELQNWLLKEHNIDLILLPVFRKGKCSYDSHLRIGWRYSITKGDCIYADIYTFCQFLEHELEESNLDDELTETMDEFLYRIGVIIDKDKNIVMQEGLLKALKLI